MEFRILGPLRVLDGGDELPLGAAKEQAVLAVLLLRVGSIVSRTHLIEALWGESPPLTAAKAVNVYVSQLRKTLARNGADVIQTRMPGYLLTGEADTVDAVRFQRLADAARERARAGETEAAAALMREALGLWRGPALMGIELEGVGHDDVARLEELRLAAQLDLVDYELALGRHEALVGELERLVAEHPLDERLRGQLVLALYRSGRQADALRAYRDARETLVEQLGLEPSASLQRLEKAVLNQDPSLEAPAGTARVAPVRSSRRRLLYAAVVLAAAAGAALISVWTSDDGRAPTVVPNSLVRLDSSGRQVEAVTPVGVLPRGAVALGNALWLLSVRNGTLLRVDANTSTVTAVALPGLPRDLAGGEGALWAATAVTGGTAVARIDPETGEVESTRRVQDVTPIALAAGQGAVWLAANNLKGSAGVLVRLSPETNSVVQSIQLPSKPAGIALGPRDVWITAQLPPAPTARASEGAIYVVDPSSSRIIASGRAPFFPLQGPSLAVGASAAWIVGTGGTIVRLDPHTAAVTRVLHAPLPADALAVSAGSVWVAADGGALYRLDPRTGSVRERVQRSRGPLRPTDLVAGAGHLWLTIGPRGLLQAQAIPAPGGPTRIRYGADAAWTVSLDDNRLLRISPQSERVVARFPAGGWGDVAFADGSVWATRFNDNVVERIDPKTNRVIARIPTQGAAPMGIAVADGAVWVANIHAGLPGGDRTGSVVRIDPRRNRVVAKIPLGAHEDCCGPDNMIAAFGDIWVGIPNQHLIVRIDARRTRVAAQIQGLDGCGQLAAGKHALWAANGCSPGLVRIDPQKNRVVARIDTNGSPAYTIDYADGSAWTTTDDLRLLRVDPTSNSIVSATDVAPTARPNYTGPYFAFGAGSLWISDYVGRRVLRVAIP